MTNIQCQTLQTRHIEARQVFDSAISWLWRLPLTFVGTLLVWQRRADERGRLASLDTRLLRDMGISEAAAAREAAIPFWRAK